MGGLLGGDLFINKKSKMLVYTFTVKAIKRE